MNSDKKTQVAILDIIARHCLFTGPENAAIELHRLGVSEEDFVGIITLCSAIPDHITLSIQTVLRDLDKNMNTLSPSFEYDYVRKHLSKSNEKRGNYDVSHCFISESRDTVNHPT